MDHPAARLDTGQCVGGSRFEILRHLGSGGMGVVYLAFDRERRSQVALKTLRQFDPAALYRLKREFRSLSDVVHPNLATLYELISEGDLWFLTMEYVPGTNFIDYVRPRWGGASAPTLPFSPTTVIEGIADAPTEDLPVGEEGSAPAGSTPPRWPRPRLDRLRAALSQLAEGVMALHAAGKLHRDLKPPNVLVTAEKRVVILDFGLATELDTAGQGSSADRVVGTAAYMSPEQGAGLPLTEASDWYSVGVMLFETLTGRQPFVGRFAEMLLAKRAMDAPDPATLASGIPDDLDSLTLDLLRRQPRDRPSGAEVLRRIGWAPAASSAPRAVSARPVVSTLVGRERHLAALQEALRTARGGRPVARLVRGRSGMGKSALVESFLADPQAADAVVLAGRCYERESVPYKALDMVVDELSKHLLRLPQAETAAVLPRDCAFLARLFPVLNRVPAVADAPQRQADVMDPQEIRWRGFAALRELLTRLGDRCLLVLYVDDLQWGDLDSAALLAELLRPPNPPGLLLIVCCRDEDIETVPVLGSLLEPFRSGRLVDDVREIEVGPLSPPEATRMALGLMGATEPAGRAAAERIAEESGGDPFFVAELVWHFQVGGAETERRAPARAISLDQALRARMARLPEDARRLLTAVAVAGRPVSLSVAARAAELATESEGALAVLRAGHLVKTHLGRVPPEVEAFHDRIRETAVRLLDETTLQEWHRRLASALEAAPRVDHEGLAVHYRGAGDRERAAEHSSLAAAAAAKALAFEHAARLYEWAIELRPPSHPERRDLWAHRGRALACAGRGLEAARAYEEAAKGATAAESLEYHRRAAEQLLRSGHVDEGLAVLESVLSAVGMRLSKSPKGALISLLVRRAVLAVRGLRFKPRDSREIPAAVLTQIDVCWAVTIGLARIDNIRAADFQTRHLLLALRAGETYRIARALATEAGFSSTLGKPRRTERLLKAASDLAESLGQPHARGLATFAGGVAAFYQGRFRAAREGCEKAEAIFREQCTGVAWEINTAVTYSLASLFYLGEARELSLRVPLHLSEARDRGDLYSAVEFATGRSPVAWLVGDQVARARHEIAQAIRPWSRRGFHSQHFWGLVARVNLELYAGDGQTAWRLLEERWPEIARSLILRVKFDLVEILGLRARSALALAATSPPMRARLLDAAARDAARIGRQKVGLTRPVSRLLEAGVASLDGRTERALEALDEAINGFEQLEMALHAAAARSRRGQLLGGNDGPSLRAAAESYMRSEAIKKPDRMVAMLAPGFPD